MQEIVFIVHVLSVVSLVGLVLMQHGKGADMGAAFGSGSSNTMFGSTGSVSFFAKLTALIAAVFFVTSVILGVLVAKEVRISRGSSVISTVPAKAKKKDQASKRSIKQEQKKEAPKTDSKPKK